MGKEKPNRCPPIERCYPANAFVAGEDPADGFAQVQGRIVDVHCKDATLDDAETGLTSWARIGDGQKGMTLVRGFVSVRHPALHAAHHRRTINLFAANHFSINCCRG